MSDPIMQAMAGHITWAQADQLYHARIAPAHAAHDRDHAAHDHGREDGHVSERECTLCERQADDECEVCSSPMCSDHSTLCEPCQRYVCDECTRDDGDDRLVCLSCGDHDHDDNGRADNDHDPIECYECTREAIDRCAACEAPMCVDARVYIPLTKVHVCAECADGLCVDGNTVA